MAAIVMIPGFGGSGELHWQTLWERADPAIKRIVPNSWACPELSNWLDALDCAVAESAKPPVLIAHSLGCLLVAHWARASELRARGAFLVSVPDPNGAGFPEAARSFGAVPIKPLPFPALIIASSDDPFAAADHTRLRARQWNVGLVVAGALGHINASSGVGDWPQGRMLLEAFVAGVGS